MPFPAMLSGLNCGCGRLVGHQLLTHQNCLCVASITNTSKLFVCSKHFSRESYENWRKVDFGLAPEGSLRLSEDAVPRPEDFSIPSKAVCILFNHNSFDLSCVLLRTCIHNLR